MLDVGRASPAPVVRRRQVRDTWPLQGVPQGSVTLELSWLGAMAP